MGCRKRKDEMEPRCSGRKDDTRHQPRWRRCQRDAHRSSKQQRRTGDEEAETKNDSRRGAKRTEGERTIPPPVQDSGAEGKRTKKEAAATGVQKEARFRAQKTVARVLMHACENCELCWSNHSCA